MALLLHEGTLRTTGHLLLQQQAHEVACHVHVEWLRGIAEPTWYGYLRPTAGPLRILPGHYRLRVGDDDREVLVRRPSHAAEGLSFPFWGLGDPPALPLSDEPEPASPADAALSEGEADADEPAPSAAAETA